MTPGGTFLSLHLIEQAKKKNVYKSGVPNIRQSVHIFFFPTSACKRSKMVLETENSWLCSFIHSYPVFNRRHWGIPCMLPHLELGGPYSTTTTTDTQDYGRGVRENLRGAKCYQCLRNPNGPSDKRKNLHYKAYLVGLRSSGVCNTPSKTIVPRQQRSPPAIKRLQRAKVE